MARQVKRARRKAKQFYPRLAACLIVRDNQRTIEACLASIRPWVDQLIVVDTGSRDETPRIAARLGAIVSNFPWCDDFSAARNVSLERATAEWLFWMDSDDTIPEVCGRQLRALADGGHPDSILGYVMQVHCPGPPGRDDVDMTVVDHVKMFRNRPDLRFEGRIHEQIIPSIRRAGGEIAWTDIFVDHSGSEHTPAAKQRKYERDLHLLRLELERRPDHPFHLFNIGMTYNDMEAHEEAVTWLRRALAAADPGESHVRKVYALLAGSLAALDRMDEALAACQRGRYLFPDDVELLFRLGTILQHQDRLTDAAAAYREALRTRNERYFSSVDPGIGGHKARFNLALVYGDLGRHDLAEAQWRMIVESRPRYRSAWHGLGKCLLRQGKSAALQVLLRYMGGQEALDVERRLLEAEWMLAIGRPGDAHVQLTGLQDRALGDKRVDELACRFYYDHGSLPEAQAALENYLARHGDDPATLHNLGVVYYRQQKLLQAASALHRSLALRFDAPHTQQQLAVVEREMTEVGSRTGAEGM